MSQRQAKTQWTHCSKQQASVTEAASGSTLLIFTFAPRERAVEYVGCKHLLLHEGCVCFESEMMYLSAVRDVAILFTLR